MDPLTSYLAGSQRELGKIVIQPKPLSHSSHLINFVCVGAIIKIILSC